MIPLIDRLATGLIHRLDAEAAHDLAIRGLKLSPFTTPPRDDPSLEIRAFGLVLPNPVGLAAGFDKQGEVADACLGMGFGFVEVGGVTPRPQAGNPKPRVFRLVADKAVINRYGLNSDGMDAVAARLRARAGRGGIVGVNIGPNKDAANRIADYVTLTKGLGPHVQFLTVNVSSPNTPGLRDFQAASALSDILARVMDARAEVPGKPKILLKIAPDITLSDLDDVVRVALDRNVDGLVVANTSTGRPASLTDPQKGETGGLSGAPIFGLSTRLLANAWLRVGDQLPLIGCGGITSGTDAVTKLRAGATAVQLYTGLVFRGPGLIGEIKTALRTEARRAGSLTALIGRDAQALAGA